MTKSNKFSPKSASVRCAWCKSTGASTLQWAAIESIAPKIGCVPRRSMSGSSAMRSIRDEGRHHHVRVAAPEGTRTREQGVAQGQRDSQAGSAFAQAELDRRLKS
jgi:hypothetical protein